MKKLKPISKFENNLFVKMKYLIRKQKILVQVVAKKEIAELASYFHLIAEKFTLNFKFRLFWIILSIQMLLIMV